MLYLYLITTCYGFRLRYLSIVTFRVKKATEQLYRAVDEGQKGDY